MSAFKITSEAPIIKNFGLINCNLKFHSTDSQELFEKNRNRLGPNWYYYDNEITYEYNSWGYRTKEFEDLENDYMITFGCSCTEGIGLHYEDLWSTKLGKILELDVFNLGSGGTGPDFQMYNTILLFNHILKTQKLPKMVVYQWPERHRTTYAFKSADEKSLELQPFSGALPEEWYPSNSLEYGKWYFHSFLENTGELIKNTNICPMVVDSLWKSLNIKVLHWTYAYDFDILLKDAFITNNVDLINLTDCDSLTKARDCSHNGRTDQDFVNKLLLKKINTYGIR
jgi:hypothetical protein